LSFFFVTVPSTTFFSTLSLHDALPILFMTPVILFFIPVTRFTVLFLMPRHLLDMKLPTEFIVLRVPLDKELQAPFTPDQVFFALDRKSTRLNSSHVSISYAVFCLKKKK